MSTAFSSVVGGIGSWNQTGIENLWNQLAMSRIVTYREDSDQKSISLNWNLTKTIEGTFEDIVLGILLQSNQTKTQSVLVLEGTVWILDRFDLWIIYGPALFLVLVTGGIGLFWAHTGNIVREKKFSSFLVTTRSTELNALFMQPIHELMASRIKYDTQTGRFLVQGRAERENKQEEEKLQTDSVRDLEIPYAIPLNYTC